MPLLKILTNVPQSKIPKDFAVRIIPILSETVKKPPEKFFCAISGDQVISNGGNSDPVALATLESIGNLGPEENKVIAKGLTDFVNKELGVEPNKFLITFYNQHPSNVGIAGTTAEELMAKM